MTNYHDIPGCRCEVFILPMKGKMHYYCTGCKRIIEKDMVDFRFHKEEQKRE
jgi:hypothetical protein